MTYSMSAYGQVITKPHEIVGLRARFGTFRKSIGVFC
jgi:hypothetical protein